MRKLTYDIFTKNGTFVKNVTSYEKMNELKENGYQVKEKMVDMRERLFYDIYENDKLVKSVTLNAERDEALDNGYTVKPRLAWVEM